VKDEKDHHFAQFNKEAHSTKKTMKLEEKRCAEFQKEIVSMKKLIKVQG
jgi:hypothetical protein